MVTQEHELNLVPGRPSTVVHVSQYDKDSRDIVFSLYSGSEEFSIPSSASVTCEGTKNDKKGFSHVCTFTGNKVTVTPSYDMTAVAGDAVCEIVIKDKDQRLGSANFILKMEDGALGDNTDMSPSDVAQAYEILGKAEAAAGKADTATGRANDAAELIEGMTVSASKVAAGGTPTAKFTKQDGHYALALGLTVGDKGDKGDAANISIAETVTGAPGDPAKVENVGTPTDPKLKFTIPLGNQGPVSSVNGGTGDVVIGGVNLYTGTKDFSGSGWVGLGNGEKSGTYLGFTVFKRARAWNNVYQEISNVKIGDVYTLSLYAKIADTDSSSDVICQFTPAINGENGSYTRIHITKQWQRVFASFTCNNPGTLAIKFEAIDNHTIETCAYKLERGNVATDWSTAPEDYLGPFNIYDVPEMHRNIYRGKNLGDHVTEAQKAAIAAGTWDDLYVGDYWTINGRVYRIADMDYWYNCGDTAFTKHHLVIVPDQSIGSAKMNSAYTTEGGYINSEMRTKNLDEAKTIIKEAFGNLVLSHREIFVNAVTDGGPSGVTWTDSEVDLMNEIMVYGCKVFGPIGTGASVPANYTIDNSQLALFALNPRMIKEGYTYWLRDVVSPTSFADVVFYGNTRYNGAVNSSGIRPTFAIGVATASDEPVEGPEIMDTYGEEYEEV